MGRFNSKAVAGMVKALDEAKEEFVANGRGADWVAILHTIAQAFPGDRLAIYAKYDEDHPKPKKKAPEQLAVNATPKVGKGYMNIDDCADCPGGGGRQRPGRGLGPAVIPVVVGKKRKPEGQGGHLTTTEDVLEAFDGDVAIMMLHAKEQGITLGNSSKPETIARKIAHYWRGDDE